MPEILPHYINPEEWAEHVVAWHAEKERTHGVRHLLISDVDDVLLDSTKRWHELYIEIAKAHGIQPTATVPLDQFKQRGPRHYIAPMIGDDSYTCLKEAVMHDANFHHHLVLLGDTTILRRPEIACAVPDGYLSTRPAGLGEVTCRNIYRHDLARAPLLLRAENIAYDTTVTYKVGALAVTRAALDAGDFVDSELYYVDDFRAVTDEINQTLDRVTGITYGDTMSWLRIVQQCCGLILPDSREL